MTEEKKSLEIPQNVTVRSLADLLSVPPTEILAKLIANGVMAHINQFLDYDTAALLAEEFGFTALEEQAQKPIISKTVQSKTAVSRPPIITVMGHVDHGKTSLLDHIRQSNVTSQESGGITQHISAYQIDFETTEKQKRKLTFIDTPGHEAFSALRSHGAALTDLVILVVAADDGVKPQTIEVIEQAKAANAPIIVAINKIDLPGTNVEKVKQELAEHQIISEQWGGSVVMVPISAKTGQGVEELLEMVVLSTDLMNLKADPQANPEAIVIDAHLDKQVGPLATVLVYNGSLRPGQVVVVGKTYGRIRTMVNDRLEAQAAALPAQPVIISGLKDVATFGDQLRVVPSEKVARAMTQGLLGKKVGQKDEQANTFAVIIKADVGGSLAALQESLEKLQHKDAKIDIINSGIGEVTENDVRLAKTAKAIIFAFRVNVSKRIMELAEKESVEIRQSWVIYEVIEYLQAQLKDIATTTFITTEVGRLKVLEVFSKKGNQMVVGAEVIEGEARPGVEVKIFRDKEELGQAKITNLKIGKVDVSSAIVGQQCGLAVEEVSQEILKGDVLNLVETKEEI